MTDKKRDLTPDEQKAIWEVASKKWLASQEPVSLEEYLELATHAYLSLSPDSWAEAEAVRDRHVSRWLNPPPLDDPPILADEGYEGLAYVRDDGTLRRIDPPEAALFVNGDFGPSLRRYCRGIVQECYPLYPDEAAIHVLAMVMGFQPPRALRRLDKPVLETRSGPGPDRAASRDGNEDR